MNGNKLYANKKYFRRSIEFYTKSLNFAEFNGEAYSLALANRSAVFFELKDYLVSKIKIVFAVYFNNSLMLLFSNNTK